MPWRADVDPGPGGHLAVHHQALAIELVEVLPGRPVRHEVGVGDQHARRVGVGAEDADGLARLHQQRLVVARGRAARRRCGRSPPRSAPRGRCRRRRPARAGSRPRRDGGCSSASAAAPRSARTWQVSSGPVAGRTSRALCAVEHQGPSESGTGGGARGPPALAPSARRGARCRAPAGRSAPSGGDLARGARATTRRERRARWRAARGTRSPARRRAPRRRGCARGCRAIRCSRRAPWAAMETWSSWLAEVGVESVEQGCARCLFSLISAAVVTSAIMKPELRPGSRRQERRQVEGQRRVDHQRHAALRDGADLGQRRARSVGGEGHRLGVEVAARDDRPSSPAPAGCR